ncbi:MAG: hypothetical protein GY794_26875 [bacterium]|nr:hypothetical protein [bacterium]
MGDTGLEPVPISSSLTGELEKTQGQSGALSGAVLDSSVLVDVDFRLVMENWGKISGPVKAGILAMVKAAAGES